jgi:ABC-type transport system involved in multi-copper enzyme maturation permease subunit
VVWRPTFFVSLIILLFLLLISFVWNSLGDTVATMVELLPNDFQNVLESQFGFMPTAGIEGWLASVSRHPIFIVVFTAYSISVGASAIAKEIETGDILFSLSKPISRISFISGKILASIIGIFILQLVFLVGLLASLSFFGVNDNSGVFIYLVINSFLLFILINSIAVCFSSFGNESSWVLGRTVMVVLLMYFIDFICNIWEQVTDLGVISFFHYYQPSDIVLDQTPPWQDFGVLIVSSISIYILAGVLFRKRDI